MKAIWLRRYNNTVERIPVDVLDYDPRDNRYMFVLAHFAYFDKVRRVRGHSLVPEELEFDKVIAGPHLIRRIVG